jgi:uncharacterized membrane protein
METGYYELPQPEEISIREREDAMGSYLMMFAAIGAGLPLPIINLIASVIYYYMNRSNSRFVRFHSYQALASSIPLTIMNAFAMFWSLRIFISDKWSITDVYIGYVVMLACANLVYFVYGIIGAVRARKGRMFYYWVFGKMAYVHAFEIKEGGEKPAATNAPPKI